MSSTFDNVLPHGWFISSHLKAAWKFADGSVLQYGDGGYLLTDEAGATVCEGDDYRPTILATGWRDVLGGLVAFLSADAESYSYHYMRANGKHPDDGYCFDEATAEWAYMHFDELENLVCDLEPHA